MRFLIIIAMLILNGFFVAYEMALASVSRARLAVLAGRKIRGAEEAVFMKDNIAASLAEVQMGITVATAVAAVTGGLSASDTLAPWFVQNLNVHVIVADILALVFWVIPLSSVMIVFSELLPKLLALQNRERICLWLSPLMKELCYVMMPVVKIFEGAAKALKAFFLRFFFKAASRGDLDLQGLHELQAATALARTSRVIGAHQEKIVLSAAQLSARLVKEIIIPAAEVSTIPLSASLSQAMIMAHMDMHTR
jgi:putative hemolysin